MSESQHDVGAEGVLGEVDYPSRLACMRVQKACWEKSAIRVGFPSRLSKSTGLHDVGAEGVLGEVGAGVLGHELLDEGEEPRRRPLHPAVQLQPPPPPRVMNG